MKTNVVVRPSELKPLQYKVIPIPREKNLQGVQRQGICFFLRSYFYFLYVRIRTYMCIYIYIYIYTYIYIYSARQTQTPTPAVLCSALSFIFPMPQKLYASFTPCIR